MSTMAVLGDTGIILNGPSPDIEGCVWGWSGNDPWSPSPGFKEVTGDNAYGHGSWDATQFYGPRSYPLEGYVRAPDHAALHRAKSRFFAACRLSVEMRVIEPGFDRTATFRRAGEPLWSETPDLATARFSVPLWAGDPRAYASIPDEGSTGFLTTTGGLTWPTTWPATWTAVIGSGDLVLENIGTDTAWPVYRIDGPVTNPALIDLATGRAMRFDLELQAGQWLSVDTAAHRVLADGDPSAPRRDKFWGDWFGLEPGTSTVRFTGDSAGPEALLTATYRSVWI